MIDTGQDGYSPQQRIQSDCDGNSLNEGEEWLDQLLAYLSDNIDFVVEYCRKHIPCIKPMRPDATYLVWLDCRDLHLNQEELNAFFIQEAKLGLNNGGDFERGLEGICD